MIHTEDYSALSFSNFYEIDPRTAQVTLIGPHSIPCGNALEFKDDGTLYGVGCSGGSLFTIDTATGVGTPIGYIGYSAFGDLAFNNGRLYLAESGDRLVEIDLSNGAVASVVGPIGFSRVWGLDTDANGTLFGFSETNVLSIDTTTGAGTLVFDYRGPDVQQAYGASSTFDVIATQPVPVVLVHGICGAPDTSFGMMRDLLTMDGLDVAEPFDYSRRGFSKATIEKLAGKFSEHVKEVLRASGASQVDVVAHSMGGLIARAWMAKWTTGPTVPYQETGSPAKIRRLILVGTPNYGAKSAVLNGLVGVIGCSEKQVEQMRFGSKFVWDLHDAWQRTNPSGDVLFVAGTQDNDNLIINYECDGFQEGCDDGVVDISSAVLPNASSSKIRYIPYRHAYINNIPGAFQPRYGPTLVRVTDAQHATYRLVSEFLRNGIVLPQCCGDNTVNYNPPHLRANQSSSRTGRIAACAYV